MNISPSPPDPDVETSKETSPFFALMYTSPLASQNLIIPNPFETASKSEMSPVVGSAKKRRFTLIEHNIKNNTVGVLSESNCE